MKSINKIITLAGILLTGLVFSISTYSQKWIKIEVEKSGPVSVSYERLRELGFSTPEKVGVVGRGGRRMEISATPSVKEEVSVVPVLHTDDKLIFYAIGPESYGFSEKEDLSTGGTFINNGLNIYSLTGVYFLSDEEGTQLLISEQSGSESENVLPFGVTFISHEEDLQHNTTNTGNLFWGECFNKGEDPSKSWDIDLNDAIDRSTGYMEVCFYSQNETSSELTFGVGEDSGLITKKGLSVSSDYLIPLPDTGAEVTVKRGDSQVKIKYECSANTKGIANLDYWVLTYLTDGSDAVNGYTSTLAFPSLRGNESGTFIIDSPSELIGFDITNPFAPELISVKNSSGSHRFNITSEANVPLIVFFNPEKELNRISDWKEVTHTPFSTSLRDKASKGADLLIISTEDLLDYANRIAALHEEYDGIKVLVAERNEVYTEYSEGLPDPESYRRLFAGTGVDGGQRPLNILLVGPFSNDIRDIRGNRKTKSAHISPQASAVDLEMSAYPTTDFYTVVDEPVNPEKIESALLSAGIGCLPFYNEEDAKNYVEKLERYLNSYSDAKRVNEWLFIGGTGDDHTHDTQSVKLADYVSNQSNGAVIPSILALDAYGREEARERFERYVGDGKQVIIYFGHASNFMFEQEMGFLSVSNIKALQNDFMPFFITAGCSTTGTDVGNRGLSEEFVLGSPNGCIAAFGTLRETWSGQNYDFMKTVTSTMVNNHSTDRAMTIGEIMKDAKNKSKYINNLAFLLLGDPALKIPMPSPGVEIEPLEDLNPGDIVKVKGHVAPLNGEKDDAFRGNVSVKIVRPPVTLQSSDYVTSGKNQENTLNVTYSDMIISIGEGEVTDGEFTVEIPTGSEYELFKGQDCRLYVTCRENGGTRNLVASYLLPVSNSSSNQSTKDTNAPTISYAYYDDTNNSIVVEVNDDSGLSTSSSIGFNGNRVWIDGKTNNNYALNPSVITDGGKNVTYCGNMPLLSDGYHRAEYEVYDINGNRIKGSLDFNIGDIGESLRISSKEKVINGPTEFNLSESLPEFTVVIKNQTGSVIRKITGKGNSFTWDAVDSQGHPAGKGLVKISVIETGSGTVKRCSSIFNIPVVP